ncbi:MAG: aldo/keto reductase [Deltaproteobacteria bacterium]|jgi:aryl-alcohol dehydrogenase-like predicted oxidoreductase|nr:aldo/keto reductase [Deltaproteobacteria bacterium]
MKYVKLGNTGLDVSPLCLGCMSFGDPEGWVHKWALNEEQSRPIIQKALGLGINFFDTANVYSLGRSEEILGRAIRDFAKRDEVVVATKVYWHMREGFTGGSLSRKAILSEIDNSLERMGLDYIDLYIIHRWDYGTPIEETMEALHDVVKAGKARYLGASAMWAWQFQKAQYVAEKHGWTRFASMQNHYNLVYREEEREMLPLCKDLGVGLTPYSPLAAGRLSRAPGQTSERYETDKVAQGKYDANKDADRPVIERVGELAERRGLSMTQVALAWLLHKAPVISPIIGSNKMSHLENAVDAVSVALSPEEIAFLEDPYTPHPVQGHS